MIHDRTVPGTLGRVLCLLLFALQAGGQNVTCPPNIDFEAGSFLNWQCFTGSTSATGTNNQINVSASTPTTSRHEIYSTAANSTQRDPYGNFPVVCPNGSNYSIRLGNSASGAQAERVSYTFTIPAGQTEYSIVYQYAVVFEDPQHLPHQQPRFVANIFDVTNNTAVGCATFNHVSSRSIPGFQQSPTFTNVVYKDWTPVTINLSGYAGRTIRLEFTTADCTLGAHFGYAYVDVNVGCTSPVRGASFCPGANSVNLTAPFGYQSYTWYDQNLTTVLGTQSTLTINPPPPINTVYALDIVPFPGLGCRDTVFATIRPAQLPPVDAGPDRLVCSGTGAAIGTTAVPGLQYAWLPVTGLSSANSATPQAVPPTTTNYELSVTDPNSGCTAKDSVRVTVSAPPSAVFNIATPVNQCIGSDLFQFQFVNPNQAPSFTWYWGDGNTGTGTAPTHSYGALGTYTVKLVVSSAEGCHDSTQQTVRVNPLPTGTLSCPDTKICEGTPAMITGSGGTQYNWLRDGVPVGSSPSTFGALQAGTYTAEIVDANACRNMASNSIVLGFVRKPSVNFNFDRYCMNLPVTFTNSSSYAGSLPVAYLWDFGDSTQSTDRDPVHTFGKPDSFNVKLTITPADCPGLATTVVKKLPIEAPVKGIEYVAQNAVSDRQLQLRVRNIGRNYQWSPGTWLSSTTSPAPYFKGNSEQRYTISYLTASGCTTVDTLLVRMFKERDIYVPLAFTPNGDGQNDRMFPFLVGIRQLTYFRILNRWGVVVYESRTDLPGWDGTLKGAPQPMGGYMWECQAIDINGQTIARKGSFTLIR